MQPTFKQVPPREPRFSMQVTFIRERSCQPKLPIEPIPRVTNSGFSSETNLHALLSSLDSSDVASNATTDNNEILLLCNKFESAGCSGSCSDELGGNIPAAEAYPRVHRDSEGEATTLGSLMDKKRRC
jgi:hypothetical protein